MEFEDYIKGQNSKLPVVSQPSLNSHIRLQYSARNLKSTLQYEGAPTTLTQRRGRSVTRQVAPRSTSRHISQVVDTLLEYNSGTETSTKKRLELIFNTLEQILHYETRFPEQIRKLISDLKSYLYVNVAQLNQWTSMLVDHVSEGKLKRILQLTDKEKAQTPIFTIYALFVKEILLNVQEVVRVKSTIHVKDQEMVSQATLHEQVQRELNQEIVQLKRQVESLKASNNNVQLADLVQKLRQNQKDITIQNEKIMEENYNLVSQNDMLQKTVTQLNELIFTFKNDYQEKTTEMSEFMKQFKAIEAKLGAYKDMFDKGIYKMVLLRNESRQLNDKLNDLHSENNRLSKRAAVAYEELTPRPKFREVFKNNGLDYAAIFQDESSTDTICTWLVEQLKHLYESAMTLESSKGLWVRQQKRDSAIASSRATQAVAEMVEIKNGLRRLEINNPPQNIFKQ